MWPESSCVNTVNLANKFTTISNFTFLHHPVYAASRCTCLPRHEIAQRRLTVRTHAVVFSRYLLIINHRRPHAHTRHTPRHIYHSSGSALHAHSHSLPYDCRPRFCRYVPIHYFLYKTLSFICVSHRNDVGQCDTPGDTAGITIFFAKCYDVMGASFNIGDTTWDNEAGRKATENGDRFWLLSCRDN